MSKSKTTTLILLIMTIVLMAGIIAVGYLITKPEDKSTSIAPHQTKAQSRTYSRLIAMNTISPTIILSPTVELMPSPTEIVLARSNTPTPLLSSLSASVSGTITPTKTASLPATGTVGTALFIFAAASLMVFFSFLF